MGYNLLDMMGLKIPYCININKKLKHIRLAMEKGCLKVSLPYDMNICEVERLLRSKEGWICSNYKKHSELTDECGTNRRDEKKALYKGREYNIIVHESDKKGRSAVFNKESIEIHINREEDGGARELAIEEALKRLYVKMARILINARLRYFADIMGLSYNDVRIKDQKTRWGSCSGKRNLNFNFRLVMAPEWVMDYVIVHELTHLKHMDHSRDFWNMVSTYMPEYSSAKKWLKENGHMLRII